MAQDMNTDLDQLTDLEALPVENTFSNAVLPLAAAALQDRRSRKVLFSTPGTPSTHLSTDWWCSCMPS